MNTINYIQSFRLLNGVLQYSHAGKWHYITSGITKKDGSFLVALDDIGKYILVDSDDYVTVKIPNLPFQVGSSFTIEQEGTGDVVVESDYFTIVGNPLSGGQNKCIQVLMKTLDTWTVIGGVEEPLGTFTISKTLTDADGGAIASSTDEFSVTVTGPYGYSYTGVVSVDEDLVIENLKRGDYTISEAERDHYTFGSLSVEEITVDDDNLEFSVTSTSQQDPTTSLTITKLVQDSLEAPVLDDTTEFTVNVVGPEYDDDVVITISASGVIDGLYYGTYTITETVPTGYILVDMKSDGVDLVDGEVTLSAENLEVGVSILNELTA